MICERPGENVIDAGDFVINHQVVCPANSNWLRLDCRFQDRKNPNHPPFFASRMGMKPTAMTMTSQSSLRHMFNDYTGLKGSANGFSDRIRCDKQNLQNELIECEALLAKFLQLETEMCKADHCDAAEDKPHADAAAAGTTAGMTGGTTTEGEIASDEKDGKGMSPTTIGLIAGGSILAIGIGIGAMKMMSASSTATNANKKGKRNKDRKNQGASSSSQNNYDEEYEENEGNEDLEEEPLR